METILCENMDGILCVTLNRPDKLNALNFTLLQELQDVFRTSVGQDEVRGVIITGSGTKGFAAGADIGQLAELDAIGAKSASEFGQSVFRMIEHCPKPVIAAINGFALGGGCELALACHLRIAVKSARLGLPEVGLGLIPGYGGTQRLARLVGKGRALELILTGGMVHADRAYEMGLVNQVCEDGDLLSTSETMMRTMLAKGPLALKFALEAVNQGLEGSQLDGERLEANLFGLAKTSQDCAEGLSAFLEKRKPNFKGC